MKKLIAFFAISVVWLISVECRADNSVAVAATATVITPVIITSTANLKFGAFASQSRAGVISIAADGTRTGTVVLLSADPSGAASFTVTGEPDAAFAVSFPDAPASQLRGTVNAGYWVVVTNFTTRANLVLDGSSSRVVTVGGDMDAPSNQATGSYSGDFFPVAVGYN